MKLTRIEAAIVLGISRQRLHAIIKSGRLKTDGDGLLTLRQLETFERLPAGRPRIDHKTLEEVRKAAKRVSSLKSD